MSYRQKVQQLANIFLGKVDGGKLLPEPTKGAVVGPLRRLGSKMKMRAAGCIESSIFLSNVIQNLKVVLYLAPYLGQQQRENLLPECACIQLALREVDFPANKYKCGIERKREKFRPAHHKNTHAHG